MAWKNWSGRQVTKQAQLLHIRSEADAQALVANTTGQIRATGAGHSHAPLIPNDDIVVNTDPLSGVISTNPDTHTAHIWAGTRIYALGRPLHDAGLGLTNQGDIDQQSIAGATATGTHGTGSTLRNLSAAVTELTLVAGDGTLTTANARHNEAIFQAARLHLGAFGLVTSMKLQCEPAYRLHEQGEEMPYEQVLQSLPDDISANRHYEFFWYPKTDQAVTKKINKTTRQAQYPLAAEGQRCAWSYEVLPNYRPHKHTEMEYSVPAERGAACFAEIRRLLHTRFNDVAWPVEYRTLAADDVWLSTAYERETVTISVHQDVREDETNYYRACEEIFLHFGGRPHWGKVNYLSGDQLAAIHPMWGAWWQARDAADPQARFLGPYLASIRPG